MRTPRVLLQAGLCVSGVLAVTTLVGALSTGSSAACGALVGGALTLLFFVFGAGVVSMATRATPETALLIALMTYALQLVLAAAAFSLLSSSGAIGTTLAAGWVVAGVAAGTVAWTSGLMVASARARVPVYDVELPTDETTSDAPKAGAR